MCSLFPFVILFDNLFSLRNMCFSAEMGVSVDECIDGCVNEWMGCMLYSVFWQMTYFFLIRSSFKREL